MLPLSCQSDWLPAKPTGRGSPRLIHTGSLAYSGMPGQHNRASLFLVDLPTARDLLLRAKHLFVAAMVAGADISKS